MNLEKRGGKCYSALSRCAHTTGGATVVLPHVGRATGGDISGGEGLPHIGRTARSYFCKFCTKLIIFFLLRNKFAPIRPKIPRWCTSIWRSTSRACRCRCRCMRCVDATKHFLEQKVVDKIELGMLLLTNVRC